MSSVENSEFGTTYGTVLPWYVRFMIWLEAEIRPYLGWGVLSILILLALSPAYTLRLNDWVDLGNSQTALEAMGPFSVLTVWMVAGWRRPRDAAKRGWLRTVLMTLAVLVVGATLISQAAVGWIPGPGELFNVARNGDWAALPRGVLADWSRLGGRVAFWWAGVQAETTTQDNQVFVLVAATIVWLLSALSAALARRGDNGLIAAAPLLWLLATILLYSGEGRLLFVFAVGLALLLHLLIDHQASLNRWLASGYDYSPGIFLDRILFVLGASLLILTLAAVVPNLYVQAVVDGYYAEMKPVYEQLEDTADRLFPGVKGTSRLRGGQGGGLPNEFLLSAGPDLSDDVVMYVSTSDAPPNEYPYDDNAPAGHYMRGGTLSVYDGRGWSNTSPTERRDVAPNTLLVDEAMAQSPVTEPQQAMGRKDVVQQVALAVSTQVVYAAAEPVEVSAEVRLEERSPGDIVAIWSRDRSYTAVSLVPAVSESSLEAVESWGDGTPLPERFVVHLELPETVTQRTLDLAQSLVADEETMYGRARAIETYLRGFEYDLDVSAPPSDVADVADYFLFDLQRGYCDYYATAFIVLARAAGIPARFATGFVPGGWNPTDGRWTITEAEAHSWPEVYFPQYGWIPFEPTAGRAELTRIGLPVAASSRAAELAEVNSEDGKGAIEWNWQMLVWLVPLGLILWGTVALIRRLAYRGEDPWQMLVRWGGRAGRPMATSETILEYGHGLADYVVTTQKQRQDLARIAATEMRELSGAVSSGQYAPEAERTQADVVAKAHWHRLREYLRSLRRV